MTLLVPGFSDTVPAAMLILVPQIFPVGIFLCSKVVVSNHSSILVAALWFEKEKKKKGKRKKPQR